MYTGRISGMAASTLAALMLVVFTASIGFGVTMLAFPLSGSLPVNAIRHG